MKIAFLSTLYAPYIFGGADKAATLLAEAVAADGHEVCVITLHPKDEEEIDEIHNVRIYRLPLDNIYWPFQREHPIAGWKKAIWHIRDIWNMQAARRVGRILDVERPDVVHSHSIAGFSVAALREVKRRNIRLVQTIHDFYLICQRSSMFRGGKPCAKRCSDCRIFTTPRRWGTKFIDEAIPVSQYMLNRHRAEGYFNEIPACVLPNVNDMLATSGAHETPGASTASGQLVFGYIGRVERAKGIEVLLEACSRLQGDWKLRVAGHAEPEYLKQLKERYPQGQIEWLGFVKAREFYHSIDVCIVPSVWAEPWGYVVVEALDAGKTLIVSNAGALPEMAALALKCQMFPAGDAEALAALLEGVQRTPAEWRRGGFRSVELRNRFRTGDIVAAHMKLYQGSEVHDNQDVPA